MKLFPTKFKLSPISSLTLVLTMVISAGCAKISHVSTNLDQDNFKDYFSATKVKIYNNETEFPARYKLIGLVEGESCQEEAHHELPNEIDARTQARKNAFKLNANAIIFSQCVLISDDKASRQCLSSRVCYGRAYQVETEQND